MTYAGEYLPTLGPCRCQGCGEPVWWAKRMTRRLGIPALRFNWREEDGVLHRCPNVVVKAKASKSQIRQETFHHHAVAS